MTFAAIEAKGLEGWLAGLREELISKTYRPDPVRRAMIPKPHGEDERSLGIPTIRDRGPRIGAGQRIGVVAEWPLDKSCRRAVRLRAGRVR